VAANILSKPLLEQHLEEEHLAEVQHQREFPTKFIQGFQAIMQKRLLTPALASTETTVQVPALVRMLVRMPILRDLPPRLIGFGVQRVRVDGLATLSQADTPIQQVDDRRERRRFLPQKHRELTSRGPHVADAALPEAQDKRFASAFVGPRRLAQRCAARRRTRRDTRAHRDGR